MLLMMHLLLNAAFQGDNHQVLAISQQLQKNPFVVGDIYQYPNDQYSDDLLQTLGQNLTAPGRHIFLMSGDHGNTLLKNPEVRTLIEKQKPFVIWVGHQDPGVIVNESLLNLVALPLHITQDKPALADVFGSRLIRMQAVPNTLQEADLEPALIDWQKRYPNECIPASETGYIGVFLGGDAPTPEGVHYYWTEAEAYEQGQNFGRLAGESNKFLLVTNGPRTGKFYSDSPDSKEPIPRHFQGDRWLSLEELSIEQMQETDPKQHPIAHTKDAPRDPVSEAFIAGIRASGLTEQNYRFFDFKFGKSAYKPLIALLAHDPKNSIACYSGESISYAEIAYWIDNTYAFRVASMNVGHQLAMDRFREIGMIAILDFQKPLVEQPIDLTEKKVALNDPAEDAKKIVGALRLMLLSEELGRPTIQPLTIAVPVNPVSLSTHEREEIRRFDNTVVEDLASLSSKSALPLR